jgi:hypothetical protein
MAIEFKFTAIEAGTIYLIPNFVKCIHCQHEIPIGEIASQINNDDTHLDSAMIIDNGGCGQMSLFMSYAKYFGVIKNVQ